MHCGLARQAAQHSPRSEVENCRRICTPTDQSALAVTLQAGGVPKAMCERRNDDDRTSDDVESASDAMKSADMKVALALLSKSGAPLSFAAVVAVRVDAKRKRQL